MQHDHDHANGHGHPPHHGDGHHHHHHHGHGPGHNGGGDADHLGSHAHGDSGRERADEIRALASSFIDGFRAAADKNSYLRIAGVPFQRAGADGLVMNLVDAAIVSNWQLGTASPAFASRELVYLPYPGNMVSQRETMTFIYVSLTARADIDLRDILENRLTPS